MIAADLSRAIDPSLIGPACGLTLDPWQRDLLRSDAHRVLMLCSRQSGKSTVAALHAIQVATSQPGALVLLVSPSQRQSAELFRSLMVLFRQLKDAPTIRAESVLRLELENGSRIVALPGASDSIRGYSSADLICCDEAARIDDNLLAAIRPMLAVKNGALIMLTTPAGKRGAFYEAWIGDPSWQRVKVGADQCPRISKEFLAEELRELGALQFSEEYGLEFLEDTTAVFSMESFDHCISHDVKELWTS